MKFSIITVSYNSENTIERTISSILAQSYSDFEYIIVDGASRDRTIDIVKKFEKEFVGKMRYVSEPDNGIYDAMNKGISLAKGEIVGIVNSDDWLDSNALQNVYDALVESKHTNAVITGDIRYYYNDGSDQVISYGPEDLKRYAKMWRIGVNHPATFVSRKLYDDYGLFDTNIKLQADGDLITRLYYNNVPFVFIKKVLSNQSDGGASTKNFDKALHDYKYILKKNVPNPLLREYYYVKFLIAVQIKKIAPVSLLKIHRR